MITISLQPTMGVAWHRFLAFFNIWFKRHADGRTSLGALQPITVGGKPIDFENIEDLDEDAALGVGKVEDFTWKGLLDFTTCTECGRCQSQCPAWNTDKPLSPKLLVMALRDHAHAKAPWLLAAEEDRATGSPRGRRTGARRGRALVGATGYDIGRPARRPTTRTGRDGASSTRTCCGPARPAAPASSSARSTSSTSTDRRHAPLPDAHRVGVPRRAGRPVQEPREQGQPVGHGAAAAARLGQGPAVRRSRSSARTSSTPTEVDYLFWVGCAGAYEDRAKKTTRAVAELLDTAGVSFAVLGDGETCTGDSARRAGNEFLFQMLAQQNVETLNEVGATKIVVTCAHCFNTIKNEYPQLGGQYEVVHHTQLLNRLVREKRLVPVARPGDGRRRPRTPPRPRRR